jgi:hypothetical protein
MDHWVWRRNCTVSNAGGHLDLAIGGNLGGPPLRKWSGGLFHGTTPSEAADG